MKYSFEQLKSTIIPCLFSTTLTFWMMDILFENRKILTMIISITLNALLFILFSYFKDRGKMAVVYFTISHFVYMSATFSIISSSADAKGIAYLFWLKSGNPIDSIGYWIGSIMLLAYLFGGAVFYFTCVHFRMPVILLISMIVLIMQGNRKELELSPVFIVFAVLFFMLFAFKASNSNFIKPKIFFIVLMLSLIYIIPKPEILPKSVLVDVAINKIVGPLGGNIANLSGQQRGNRLNTSRLVSRRYINQGLAPNGNIIVAEVEADEPLYLRIQSFDKYEKNCWSIGDKGLTKGYEIDAQSMKRDALKFNNVVTSMSKLMNDTKMQEKFPEIDQALQYPSSPQKEKRAIVNIQEYMMSSFLNPPGFFNLRELDSNKKIYFADDTACFLGNGEIPDIDAQYVIEYASQDLNINSKEFRVLTKINSNFFKTIQERYRSNPSNFTDEEGRTLSQMDDEYNKVHDTYMKLPEDISEDIYALAHQLTFDKNTDYEKALAIQNYFYTSGFVYDDNPQRISDDIDYNEYFLFESKRGLCVQFASSMVLLARASGLPARYVEGFVAREKDPVTNKYIVREEHAHAFPEVYISGYGWMVFEPTVGIQDEEEDTRTKRGIGSFFDNTLQWILSIPLYMLGILVFIIVLLITGVYWFIRIQEMFWRKKMLRISTSEALEEIFIRINSFLRKLDLDKKSYETLTDYSLRIYSVSEIHMEEFIKTYNRLQYGDIEPTKNDIKNALEVYLQVRRFIKESRKNRYKFRLFGKTPL